MSKDLLLVVASSVAIGILIALMFKRSALANCIAIFLMAYPLAIWAFVRTYELYQLGFAPTISRHNTAVLLASNQAYGWTSITFHVLLGLFLLAASTYFGTRKFKEWRSNAA